MVAFILFRNKILKQYKDCKVACFEQFRLFAIPGAAKVLLFIFFILSGSLNIELYAQTTGNTFKAGQNAGNPSTKRAPITEIVDFKGYNEVLAASDTGQSFQITLISGHVLKFNLRKQGTPLAAVPPQTNTKASMGRIAYKPSSGSALPALYTTEKPSDVTLIFDKIAVFQRDGHTALSNWNLVLIDAEVTNILESITTTTNGQNWSAWDLITNTSNNPTEVGIGTSNLTWSGKVNTETGSYAAASMNPTRITSVLKGKRQGIALAIQSFEDDITLEACSGSSFTFNTSRFDEASQISYTWTAPVISGQKGAESLSGGAAQSTAVAHISQALINETDSIATAIYTIIPHHISGTDLSSFKLTVLIPRIAKAIASSTTICAGTPVTLTGTGAASYTWDRGVTDGKPFIPVSTSIYTVTGTNAKGCANTDTITITVVPCPPVALDDTFTGLEDLQVGGTVATNDTEPKGFALSFTALTQPANGALTFNSDGTFTFLPDRNWNGSTSFEYKACDPHGLCDSAVTTITISPVNDSPVPAEDEFTSAEDSSFTGSVALNDLDPDGDPLTFTLISQPENGTIIFKPDGSFTFTPNINWNGTTEFKYQVCDANQRCETGTSIVIVIPDNDPPVAMDDHFDLHADKPFQNKITPNDSDPEKDSLAFTRVSVPSHGQLTFNPDGSFTYLPDIGYFGDDQFLYRACDPSGACDEAIVTLAIRPSAIVNLTPSFSRIVEGGKVTITAVLTQPMPEDIEVTLGYSGDAQDKKDYKLLQNYVTIKIPAGKTITKEVLVISSIIDQINEKDEHVLVTITQVNSYSVQIGTAADVIILDDYPVDKIVTETNLNQEIKPDPLMSPNNDDQGNDHFQIGNIEQFGENEVLIFNRWGNEVYRISGYNNLDKSFQGIANAGLLTNKNKDLPEGVYFYLIYTKDSVKNTKLNKGYLILKR